MNHQYNLPPRIIIQEFKFPYEIFDWRRRWFEGTGIQPPLPDPNGRKGDLHHWKQPIK